MPRLLLYVPMMLAVPGAVHVVSTFSHSLGETFALQSGVSFGYFMEGAADAFSDFGILDFLGRAFMALVLTCVFIFSLLVWMIEDLVAEYALWLLTVMVPIATAMSLLPSNKRMMWRIIGVVIGCALVPTVTRFAFWAMFQMIGDVLADGMSIMALIQGIVVIVLSTSMPVVFGFVMPALMPNGAAASDGAAGGWQSHVNAAGGHAKTGVERLQEKFRGEGGSAEGGLPERVSASSEAAPAGQPAAANAASKGAAARAGGAAAGSGGAAASAGGGAAAGGASAGAAAGAGKVASAHPVAAAALAAVMVAKAGGDAVKGAARESALRMNSAAGGGYATDPDTSSPAKAGASLPGRRDRDGDGIIDQVDAAESEPVPVGPRYSPYDEGLPGRSGPPSAPAGVAPVVTRPGRSTPPPAVPTRKGPPAPPPPPTLR